MQHTDRHGLQVRFWCWWGIIYSNTGVFFEIMYRDQLLATGCIWGPRRSSTVQALYPWTVGWQWSSIVCGFVCCSWMRFRCHFRFRKCCLRRRPYPPPWFHHHSGIWPTSEPEFRWSAPKWHCSWWNLRCVLQAACQSAGCACHRHHCDPRRSHRWWRSHWLCWCRWTRSSLISVNWDAACCPFQAQSVAVWELRKDHQGRDCNEILTISYKCFRLRGTYSYLAVPRESSDRWSGCCWVEYLDRACCQCPLRTSPPGELLQSNRY